MIDFLRDLVPSALFWIAAGKVVVVFILLLLITLLVIWMERKVLADMQSRVGPNRWGPFGLGQTLADGIKLFFKEDFRPALADKWTYALAPVATMVPAFLAFAVVPFGGAVIIAGHETNLVIADLEIGVLFFLAMGSIGVYGITLGGWSSGSKYPLLGGLRATAQLISYEIAFGLSVIPVVLVAGTLSTVDIVNAQAGTVGEVTFFDGWPVLEQLSKPFGHFPNWYIWSQWPAFLIFLIAGLAETSRAPFDLPEAESELVAGFHTEFSGVRFAMFFLGEYVHMVVVGAVAVTLFFGGWHGPWLWSPLWFLIKVALMVYVFIWLRATLPRPRYDRLMWLGWKRLIPAALVWVMATAVVNTEFETVTTTRNVRLAVFGALFVAVVAWVGRGDPRLTQAVSPQRRVPSGTA